MDYQNSETIQAITNFLFIGSSFEKLGEYDLIIVLGNNDITGTIRELYKIYESSHLSSTGHIILSGNVGSLNQGMEPEAKRLLDEAISVGMPRELFWLDKQATNALENYKFSKEIIECYGGFSQFQSILCIGKAFMLRRAKMCAAACGYPVKRMTFYGTVDRVNRNIGPDTWWKSETARKRVLEEIGRISTYALKGDISLDE